MAWFTKKKRKAQDWRLGQKTELLEATNAEYILDNAVAHSASGAYTNVYRSIWEPLLSLERVAEITRATNRQAKYNGDPFMEPVFRRVQVCQRIPFQTLLRRRTGVC